MAPVLQRPVTVAVGVLLGLLLLSQVTLVIRSHSPHVLQIVLVIFGWIPFRVLLQDLDNLPPAFMTDTFPRSIILGPARLLGIISFQPLLELFSRHVDRVVEVFNDILIAFDHGDGSSCELPCEEQRLVVLGWTGRHPREFALR